MARRIAVRISADGYFPPPGYPRAADYELDLQYDLAAPAWEQVAELTGPLAARLRAAGLALEHAFVVCGLLGARTPAAVRELAARGPVCWLVPEALRADAERVAREAGGPVEVRLGAPC